MSNERWTILDALVGVILFNRKGCVVEIGSGESTNILAKYSKEADVNLYTCDLNKNIPLFFNKHFHFQGSSFEFIKQFNDIPAVVFLDGNHDYEITSKEVEFFLEKLLVGGVIFLHDTYPPSKSKLVREHCSDSYRLRQEYEKRKNIVDTFTWPYTAGDCGLTMIIKKSLDRPFYRE